MNSRLIANPRGGYRFLPGIEPYSAGVVAERGFEIVHVTLAHPLPWHEGIVAIGQHLVQVSRDQRALCGVELRCPEPFSTGGFMAFNRQYRSLLEELKMFVGDENPIARTNVSPVEDAPSESVVYGFSYTQRSRIKRPTFVVAGGGEVRGSLDPKNIVRVGETSEDAIVEKARCVVEIMQERLAALGNNDLLSHIAVYTAHEFKRAMAEVIIPGLPAAVRLGVRWYYSRPPLRDIEFEMDMRGVEKEIVIDLRP